MTRYINFVLKKVPTDVLILFFSSFFKHVPLIKQTLTDKPKVQRGSNEVWSCYALKKTIFKNMFFSFVDMQSYGTLMGLILVGNSFRTCIISVDLGKALVMLFTVQQIHSNFKLSCQIDRGHTTK